MYHYIDDKEFLNASRSVCSQIICRTRDLLYEKEINSQPILVGSGARNLITQNGNESVDFDYNLEILFCEDFDDCKEIKKSVKECFNKALHEHNLWDCDDSTSVLTSKEMYLSGYSNFRFKIDVCIIYEDGDRWYRLIHQKSYSCLEMDQWYWNEGFSKHYVHKVKKIKEVPGAWNILREKYIDRKNKYLKEGDYNHPSFICYVEVVNDLYNELRQKKKIK